MLLNNITQAKDLCEILLTDEYSGKNAEALRNMDMSRLMEIICDMEEELAQQYSMELEFQPTKDRVVVKVDEVDDTTSTGILLGSNDKDKPLEGIVYAVGPDALADGISVGDRVAFSNFSGMNITIDGEEYLIMISKEILGLIK